MTRRVAAPNGGFSTSLICIFAFTYFIMFIKIFGHNLKCKAPLRAFALDSCPPISSPGRVGEGGWLFSSRLIRFTPDFCGPELEFIE
jgi:hypothetical protein